LSPIPAPGQRAEGWVFARLQISFAISRSRSRKAPDYSLARGLASSAVKQVISVEFRDAALRQLATLLTAFQMNSMLVSVRPNVTITMPEIITEATTSPAV